MIEKNKTTNYYFLLKYLAAVTAVATATIAATIAATTLNYSATFLTIIPPIIVFPFIQPLIIAAVTLALIAYTMTCLFCNNSNTRRYTTPSTYNNDEYGHNTMPFFGGSYDRSMQYNHGVLMHNHGGSTHDHGGSTHDHGTQSSIHGHR